MKTAQASNKGDTDGFENVVGDRSRVDEFRAKTTTTLDSRNV